MRCVKSRARPTRSKLSAEYVRPRFAFMQKRNPGGVSCAQLRSVGSGVVR